MKLSRADRTILEQLQRDASLSVGDLAERVGMSKSACWRRVKRLENEGVIRRRVALLNPAALELPLTAYISIKTSQHNAEWFERFREVVRGIPGVLEAYRMSGDIDYLLKAAVRDMADYDRLYQRLIAAELFDVSSSFVMEEIKHTTELPLPPAGP